MRTLILLRHAKAVRLHEAPTDRERGLTERGRRDAVAAGAAMKAAGLGPSLALVSAASRTSETAAQAFSDFGLATVQEEALYNASAEGLWDAFAAAEAESVVLVGHNPGIGDLVADLIRQAHDRSRLARDFAEGFPTCAFAAFEIRGEVLDAAGSRLIAAWKPPRSDED